MRNREEIWDKLAIAADQHVEERDYWLKELSGDLVRTTFPYDFKESAPGELREGPDSLSFSITGELFSRLIDLSNGVDHILHMILVAGWAVLLDKYNYIGSKDIIVGSPIYRQEDDDGGELINSILPLRLRLIEHLTFKDLLLQVKETIIRAAEHYCYPMEILAEQLGLASSPLSSPGMGFPLFDAAVLVENIHDKSYLEHIRIGMTVSFLKTGDRIDGKLEYNTGLYKKSSVELIIKHFTRLMAEAVSDVNREIHRLSILTEEEKRRILYGFNDTRTEYPRDKTIHELFEKQMEKTPDGVAVIGKGHGCMNAWMHEYISITFRELNEKSNQLAQVLKEKGVLADSIIGIMMGRSIEMIIGLLGILKAGGAYLPIDPDYPQERIDYILRDSNGEVLLTSPSTQVKIKEKSIEIIDISTALTSSTLPLISPLSQVNSANLAYVIYTSGTTGRPKGTAVMHRSVINLVAGLHEKIYSTYKNKLKVGLLASFGFDASVKQIFGALLLGHALYIAPKDIRAHGEQLLEFYRKNAIDISDGTPLHIGMLLNAVNETLPDLTVRHFIIGGEALPRKTAERFLNTFNKRELKITNIYGLTECTVDSTLYDISIENIAIWDIVDTIPIGRPLPNVYVYILDNCGQLAPEGVTGELYIGGTGLARGYLNQPELTAEKFVISVISHSSFVISSSEFSTNDQCPMTNDRLYRTGDLGRWLPDGSIEFLGRIDYQVKIRGFRIELGEIENQLKKIGYITDTVVIDREDGSGEKNLAAYVVLDKDKDLDTEELRNRLSQVLPPYMIPLYFVAIDKIPITPNGKIDRKALPDPEFKAGQDYEAPRNKVEEKLAEIWSEVLGIEKEVIGIGSNFFELGGHSLKATVMANKIHKAFNVKLLLAEVFKAPTIKGLAGYINQAIGITGDIDRYISIEPVEKKEYYILSSAQKRLYILQQMELESTAYNIPGMFPLPGEGEPGIQKLEGAVARLIDRHESLRTSFHMGGNGPVQRIHKEVEFKIEYHLATEDTESTEKGVEIQNSKFKIQNSFIRPFDLSQAPLLRVCLIHTPGSKNRYLLLIDMHHIISDGISIEIMIRDFTSLYRGDELPLLRIQYKDFCQWQSSEKKKENLEQQEVYWLKEFADEIPVLNLPIDYPRPLVQSFEGEIIGFSISVEDTNKLKTLALEQNVTLYMILVAAYNILLSKLSGQEDIVIGTPVAGRKHEDLKQIVGMFVNTLALRNYPSGEKTFGEFLGEVKTRTLEAFENQEYPFEDLVEKAPLNRDTSRNPIFDVLFVLQNLEIQMGGETRGKPSLPGENIWKTSKFDMSLIAVEVRQKLIFSIEYCTNLFKKETIERFTRYFMNIISSISGDSGITKKLGHIEIISKEEKERILYVFNDTKMDYPGNKTIHELFEKQMEKTPDGVAVIGKGYGCMNAWMHEYISITFRELNEKSNQLAQVLKEKGVLADSIIGIMMGRSIEMIIGLLGILKAGGSYLPIDPEYPQERIDYMLKDSGSKILLTSSDLYNCRSSIVNNQLSMSSQKQPATSLAYIMYTSGTTGGPKGVLVTHKNVVRLVKNTNYIELTQNTRILLTGALVFDATTFEIWGSLLNGGQLVLTEKEVILYARQLGEALKRFDINTLWLSSPLFNHLSENDPGIFSPLAYLLVGGDALSPIHINRVRKALPGLAVINGYGPTENTTFSATYRIRGEFESNIPIGRPIANSTAYIVGRNDHLQPIGVSGELVVSGEGLSRGYLNNPELTSEKFRRAVISHLSFVISSSESVTNDQCPMTNDMLYRTGDLARWLPDGNIEFLGRMDHQVKIRGFRIELGEIESQLLTREEIKETVVLVKEKEDREKYLCAYIVTADRDDSDQESYTGELRKYLNRLLPDYMVPSFFMKLARMPLTPNGKINRQALPDPVFKDNTQNYTAPRDEMERKLVKIWSQVLAKKEEEIGIDDNFFQLGGHSLKATIVVAKIHKDLSVKLPLAKIFKTPTIRGLSESTRQGETHRYFSIEPVGKKEYYPLSSPQKRLYILQQMEENNIGYNVPAAVVLEGELNREKFENVFRQLISRHESLRTSFAMMAGEPVQVVHDDVEFKIEYYDYELATKRHKKAQKDAKEEKGTDKSLAGLLPTANVQRQLPTDFLRPFDLSKAPLLRVRLIKIEEAKHLLMVDMHHIITDGTSLEIFNREFMALYAGEKLPPLPLQYKDSSGWQNNEIQREAIRKQGEYWQKQFAGEIPVLHLPTDYPRPTVQGFEGRTLSFEISEEETAALTQLALAQGASLYMVLLTLYTIFLSKITGQEDIIVGTPVAGRNHADVQGIMGMFVNTLGIRNYPEGDKTCGEFFQEVKERTLEAFENQVYPFEELVEKVALPRDAGRNPLFDTMFVLQNVAGSEIKIPGLKLMPFNYESRISIFDLTLIAVEAGNSLRFTFEYGTGLFKAETIERFTGYFRKIVASVLENVGQKINEIQIISELEKRLLLEEFNDTAVEYPEDKTLHELFEEQAERTPDGVAVIGKGHGCMDAWMHEYISITFRELNEKSNQLAQVLKEKGVLTDSIIAIMMERSIEMIIGLLGILKAGGAYLPIDPVFPRERIDYMLKDSGAKLLVTTNNLEASDFPLFPATGHRQPATSLAYIIYTSGTTGKPKGVMVEHGNVVAYLSAFEQEFEITFKDIVLQQANYSFDAFVEEVFPALVHGGRVAVPSREEVLDIDLLAEFIVRNDISMISCSPLMLRELNERDKITAGNVKIFISGGDVLKREYISNLLETGTVYNTYGPTEGTVCATYYMCEDDFKSSVPIGSPISNWQVYICDRYGHLLPVGVVGELCIGGPGVTRGYLNQPELTAEKFIEYRSNRSYRTYIFFKTGDLARWLPDGNIEFLGRMDQQIKIRGFRIEPGEIESHLTAVDYITDAVVIDRENHNGERDLYAYVVSEEMGVEVDISQLRNMLSRVLPGYMIPQYFVQLDKIPLTPNGKVDIKALPGPGFKASKEYEAPGNETEEKLVEIWSEVLEIGTLQMPVSIGINENFFELGGHSLRAAVMSTKIYKAFNVRLPLTEIFKTPTIKGLAEYISRAKGAAEYDGQYASIEPVEQKGYYILSSAQKRLYILQQMEPTMTVYNMPGVIPLPGEEEADIPKIEEIFVKLIKRHESLRTSFHMMGNEPVQQIHNEVEFKIKYHLATETTENKEERKQKTKDILQDQKLPTAYCLLPTDFLRPFDLSQAPLLRLCMIHIPRSGNRHVLLLDMHHIISDGISYEILARDFASLYRGEELPDLRIQYKDFCQWQNSEKEKEKLKQQEGYWLKEYEDELPVLNLPTDYPRPAVQSFEGDVISFSISEKDSDKLKTLALEQNVTLYMVLVAACNILLAKLSSQEDIVIGTVVAGRRHEDLKQIVGMFVNTLALRNYPSGEKIFGEFLGEVKVQTLAAFENQEYPFEELVEKVPVNRDISRNPIFDVLFVLQNLERQRGGETQRKPSLPGENIWKTSKFDMSFIALEARKKIIFWIEYSSRLFKKETIERFAGYFRKIVASVLENIGQKIHEIQIVSELEKRLLLEEFNDTTAEYPGDKTIHELFEEQAERSPEGTALVGNGHDTLAVGKKEEMHITYGVLNEKANRLAHSLREKGVLADSIIGIMMERSIEMIIGLLGILKAGGAYLPIDPEYPQERIDYMLKDSGTKLLVTTNNKEGGKVRRWEGEIYYIEEFIYSSYPLTFLPSNLLNPSNLAYVIYTSGTTGKPKGTLTTHANVIRVVKNTNYIELTRQDRLLQLSNYAFDGSVFDIYGALLNGAALVLMPGERAVDMNSLAETVEIERVTVFFVTTALFNLLVDEKPGIFRYIRKVLFGGEQVSVEHTHQALDYAGKDKIIHVYGPTETTVYATYYFVDEINESASTIPIGKPISNTTAYIFDRNWNLVPFGVVGEVYIGGEGLARGYLNQPELTAEKFDQDLWDFHDYHDDKTKENYQKFFGGSRGAILQKSPPGLYKTGDLARWLEDGNIEFIGRKDQQVKIRGFRIEPREIENYLLCHGSIKETLVLAREDGKKDKYLCAYIVSDTEISISGLRDYLAKNLPFYMVPSSFVVLDKMPLTPSGKIDRKALPEPEITLTKKYIAPGNKTEERLVEIWSDVLGIEKAKIGIDDNFFELGGHSLKAAALTGKIHKAFSVEIPITKIFITPTIEGISRYIDETRESIYTPITPVEEKEYYPLSAPQKRLFLIHQMTPSSTAYNLPAMMELEGKLDKKRLNESFRKLIDRHESFRTSFELIADEPVQRIHKENYKFQITNYNQITNHKLQITNIIENFIRPFDFSKAPLLRVGLIKIAEEKHMLLVDMHHIISDGTSINVLIKDFMALYSGRELPVPVIQYKDFAVWQNTLPIKQQEVYWTTQFEDEIPVLELPTDRPRPEFQSFKGSTLHFEFDREITQALKELVLGRSTTSYMALLSLYNILLARISGQEDIVIGTPTAGRRHSDTADLIGMFVNTLAVRCQPEPAKTFTAFLAEITQHTLAAFENQDYPFEDLVDRLAVNRDTGRNPLFDVMLVSQNIEAEKLEIPGLTLSPYPYKYDKTKFDMTLTCVGEHPQLCFVITYGTDLFNKETIERFTGYFKRIVSAVLENPDQRLAEIDILAPEEKQQLIDNFNVASVEFPKEKTIPQMFEEQAARAPNHAALVENGFHALTYGEFNRRANRLACRLREKGVDADTIVGIMARSSLNMIIAVIAVLKAGGAYLPLESKYPDERIKFMLHDSHTTLVLGQRGLPDRIPSGITAIDFEAPELYEGKTRNLPPVSGPGHLVYTIYTSGSTGKPKGVLLKQENLVNYVSWFTRAVELNEKDRTILTSSFGFDLGYTAIYPSILSGCQLHVVDENIYLSPENLLAYLFKHEISYIKITPSLFSTITESVFFGGEICRRLRLVVMGGEAIKTRDIVRTFEVSGHTRIMNHYGPTEATIGCIAQFIDRDRMDRYILRPTIGHPILNSRVYILDRTQHFVPVGVSGEICISGSGLARGYLNQPELTAEKFVRSVISHSSFVISSPEFSTNDQCPMTNDRLYRTGDLGRWLPDGCIEFLGRLDNQVKIRGYRIELGEIENELLKIPFIKEAVVINRRTALASGTNAPIPDTFLCAYVVSDETLNPFEIKDTLASRLPAYAVPSYITPIDRLPLTGNGKLNRRELPEPHEPQKVGGQDEYMVPANQTELKLAELWSELLGQDIIDMNKNFFQAGGHSLKAIILISRICKLFNTHLTLADIFKMPTIRSLSGYIRSKEKSPWTSIKPAEEKEYYACTSAQKRLYTLQQMDQASTSYNMPYVVTLEGNLDMDRLEDTFQWLIKRHDSLRTFFEMKEKEPVQRIHRENYKFQITNSRQIPDSEFQIPGIIKNFVQPFDLSKAPLLRVGLIKIEAEKHVLMVDMHHVISDGISRSILVKEFTALYSKKELPPLRLQYKDYSEWQNSPGQRENISKQQVYWLRQFKGDLPVLAFPLDYPRAEVSSFESRTIELGIEEEDRQRLKTLALEEGATLYMILFAAYYIFLSNVTDQEDIIVGTPAAGRTHTDLEPLIGMFVNTLALRNYPTGEKTFREFLKEVKQNALEAFEHQDYPLEELVDQVVKDRNFNQNPLFDVMFTLSNVEQSQLEIPGLKLTPYPLQVSMAKFDFNFIVHEEERLSITCEYMTSLFKQKTIERFIGYFKDVLHAVLKDKEIRLKEISISHDLVVARSIDLEKDFNF